MDRVNNFINKESSMNGFMRHIGKQGDRKVVVIFREVPGEPHMCLIAYSEVLNAHIHDALMQCVESDIGQNSESLADALNRAFTRDGRPLLGLLHKEGLIKKVQTSTVVMVPNSQTTIKLDELNRMLDDMKSGEEAVKKMADIEATDTVMAMRGPKPGIKAVSGALGDADIAKSLMDQAQKMEREANGLLAESTRLKTEAAAMLPPAPVAVLPEVKAAKRTYTKKVKADVA
jgi:hypothetical protein